MKKIALSIATVLPLAFGVSALAKLPPLTPEAKAKAAETAARSAWSGQVANYQLCQVQTRIASQYRSGARSTPGAASGPVPAASASGPSAEATPCADPGPFAYNPETPAPPLEAAGAHSPAKTADAPPSTVTPSAEQQPAKK